MRALLVILAVVVVAVVGRPGLAAADKTVGLLVIGDYLKGPTQTQAEKWFRLHGRAIDTRALPGDAVKTLLDCFVIDDLKCSKGIVDVRAATETLVSIRIDAVSKKENIIRLTIDWFVKGHNPVTSRRTCEACDERALRMTVDAMLLDLAKASPGFMGRLKITSDPPGFSVLVDNEMIGVTPIEHDLPAGTHDVRLVRDGRMGPAVDVTVEGGASAEVKLQAPPDRLNTPPPTKPRSRVLPVTLMIAGGVAVAAGAGMYAVGYRETDDGFNRYNFKVPGLITAAAGGAVAVTGIVWFLAKRSEGPVASRTVSGDLTVGWIGQF